VAVDCLPTLFLAYCTLADSDDVLTANDQVAPRGLALDPVPLLTDCAFGLGPSFLSRSRRWSTFQWRVVSRLSALDIYLSLLPYAMTQLVVTHEWGLIPLLLYYGLKAYK
jgi:hypothetical protein